jgi:hypothetical protein
VVDVFTQTPLEGNPLAVFTDAAELDAPAMQRIARELSLSETLFIVPSRRPDWVARLRILPARHPRHRRTSVHQRITLLATLVTLLVAPAATQAQARDTAGHELLPLRFARASAPLLNLFQKDWERFSPQRREWAYCITKWTVALTPDHDSVFIAEEARLIENRAAATHTIDVPACVDSTGGALPYAHAHPSGDCSPSRIDIDMALLDLKVPFLLIVCGPTSTASYYGGVYHDLFKYHVSRVTKKVEN